MRQPTPDRVSTSPHSSPDKGSVWLLQRCDDCTGLHAQAITSTHSGDHRDSARVLRNVNEAKHDNPFCDKAAGRAGRAYSWLLCPRPRCSLPYKARIWTALRVYSMCGSCPVLPPNPPAERKHTPGRRSPRTLLQHTAHGDSELDGAQSPVVHCLLA